MGTIINGVRHLDQGCIVYPPNWPFDPYTRPSDNWALRREVEELRREVSRLREEVSRLSMRPVYQPQPLDVPLPFGW